MPALHGVDERAEQHDFKALGAGVCDKPRCQGETGPGATQRLWHIGVIGDHQDRRGDGIRQLGAVSAEG